MASGILTPDEEPLADVNGVGLAQEEIICDQLINCECTNFPVSNYSSEDPDHQIFIGLAFDWGGAQDPPLGGSWNGRYCTGVCVSTISQEDADLCAARMNVLLCQSDPNPPTTPPGTPSLIFFSRPAFCDTFCPDGSPFRYVIPGGLFASFSQTMADRLAVERACRLSRQHRMCLGNPSGTQFCEHSEMLLNISASGRFSNAGNLWRVMPGHGDLPHGVKLSSVSPDGDTASISGIPTESGTFSFRIRVTNNKGDYMERQYTICVIGIKPDTLPNGTIGTAYNQTLTADSCATPALSWQVFSGSLPPGLLLDEQTGKISGTPTTGGMYQFTIALFTQAT